MTELPYTEHNLVLIQDFLDETRKRIAEGVDITFKTKLILKYKICF